jgi:DNA-binding HxlR family transcriptional regulator
MKETFDIKWDKNIWERKEKKLNKKSDEYSVLVVFSFLDWQTVFKVIKEGFITIYKEQIADITLRNLLSTLVDMKLVNKIDNSEYPEGLYKITALGKRALKYLENHESWEQLK